MKSLIASTPLSYSSSRPTTHAPSPPARAPQAVGDLLGFVLFMLANAALFVRPSDVFPDLLGVEIYRYVLLACLVVSAPAVLHYLSNGRLDERPIDVCVYLLFPLVVLSSLAAGGFEAAWDYGLAFFKIVVYYLLLVSLVTTPRRMRIFLGWLIVFASVVTILAALDFYKVIAIPRPVLETGKTADIDPDRMYGPGIFQDPNDICVLIATCLIILLGRLADRRAGITRWLWLLPLAVFVFGFLLTRSRGGMLALLAGLAVAIRARYGWGRVLLLGLLGLPVLALMSGRQVEMSHASGTGQERIQLWNEGLVMFRANPLFGVGPEGFRERAGHVAHNSYIQAFSEFGFVAGALFLGATTMAIWGMYRLRRPVVVAGRLSPPVIVDADLHQTYPFVAGAVAAYAAGMLTLTLNSLVTTYAFLGLASLFLNMTLTRPKVDRDSFSPGLLVRLSAQGLFFLVGMFIFIRVSFRG